MGQKIHPVGFRLGIIRGHDSHWIVNKRQYRDVLKSDHVIRQELMRQIPKGLVSRIEIERAASRVKVTVFTSRPGAVIGKRGEGIERISGNLKRLVSKTDPTADVHLNVAEVRQPELDAQLVAENIAVQLEKRISHRRAMRQAVTRSQRMNGRGIKIMVSGRLNGAEIARTEAEKVGKVPLHTLRADIDYGFATADTIYGSVGIKVWIYKGEVLPDRQNFAPEPMHLQDRRPRRRDDRPGGGDRRGDRPAPGRTPHRGPRPPRDAAPKQETDTHVDA